MDVIKVEKRNEQAKANQLRRSGLVPCCVYGGDLPESISIQMDQQTANRLFHTKREGSQVGLELDGRVIPAQIKEKKKMMSGQVEHFGFQALSANKKVNSITHIFYSITYPFAQIFDAVSQFSGYCAVTVVIFINSGIICSVICCIAILFCLIFCSFILCGSSIVCDGSTIIYIIICRIVS